MIENSLPRCMIRGRSQLTSTSTVNNATVASRPIPCWVAPVCVNATTLPTALTTTQPTTIRETNVLPHGPVGDVFAYQSGHFSGGSIIAPNILFTALAGNNALVRSSPANIGLSDAALVIYR